MRKCLLLLLLLVLAFSCASAEDEELSIADVLTQVHPDVANTIQQTPTPAEEKAEEAASIYEADGSVLITLTAGGDVELGGTVYEVELTRHEGDAAFLTHNIQSTLLADDLTILNLVNAPSLCTKALYDGGAELFTTLQSGMQVQEVKGLKIANLNYSCRDDLEDVWSRLAQEVAVAKAQYAFVIVSFTWGSENSYTPDDTQTALGRAAVDAGADLVLGHGSRHIQPIEFYGGAYICYSLGSFISSADEKPDDMSSFLFQLHLRIRNDVLTQEGFRILPIRISSRTDRNDLAPSLLDKATAVDSIITTLRENAKNLPFAVEEYPLSW